MNTGPYTQEHRLESLRGWLELARRQYAAGNQQDVRSAIEHAAIVAFTYNWVAKETRRGVRTR